MHITDNEQYTYTNITGQSIYTDLSHKWHTPPPSLFKLWEIQGVQAFALEVPGYEVKHLFRRVFR